MAPRVSETEITISHNPKPTGDVPAKQQWHVHLELNPEELVALHRLGLTDGGLAWREGMEAWQPLAAGQSPTAPAADPSLEKPNKPALKREPETSVKREPQTETAIAGQLEISSQQAPAVSSKRELETANLSAPETSIGQEPRRRARDSRPAMGRSASSPAIRHIGIRPGKRVTATAIHPFSATEPPPTAEPPSIPAPPRLPSRGDSSSRVTPLPESALRRLVPESTRPGRIDFAHDGVVSEAKPTSIAPVALDHGVSLGSPRERIRMWLGVSALVVLAAGTGALVAVFVVWNLFVKGANSAASSPIATTTSASAASEQCPTPSERPPPSPASLGGAAQPASVSVDQLPLAGLGDSRGSETTPASSMQPRREARSRTSTSQRNSPARVVLAEEATRRAKSRANSQKADGIPKSPGPPDLRAVAQAVARSTGAAASCGKGPETGRVEITFAPSGGVQAVRLLKGFGEAGINACVLRAMGRAKVPAFVGAPVSVGKTVSW